MQGRIFSLEKSWPTWKNKTIWCGALKIPALWLIHLSMPLTPPRRRGEPSLSRLQRFSSFNRRGEGRVIVPETFNMWHYTVCQKFSPNCAGLSRSLNPPRSPLKSPLTPLSLKSPQSPL
jgi:hypothetical protein